MLSVHVPFLYTRYLRDKVLPACLQTGCLPHLRCPLPVPRIATLVCTFGVGTVWASRVLRSKFVADLFVRLLFFPSFFEGRPLLRGASSSWRLFFILSHQVPLTQQSPTLQSRHRKSEKIEKSKREEETSKPTSRLLAASDRHSLSMRASKYAESK